mgnify:CR=1 FL=1
MGNSIPPELIHVNDKGEIMVKVDGQIMNVSTYKRIYGNRHTSMKTPIGECFDPITNMFSKCFHPSDHAGKIKTKRRKARRNKNKSKRSRKKKRKTRRKTKRKYKKRKN